MQKSLIAREWCYRLARARELARAKITSRLARLELDNDDPLPVDIDLAEDLQTASIVVFG